jgi:hypothetical protein
MRNRRSDALRCLRQEEHRDDIGVTPAQCWARGLLNWDRARLATAAAVDIGIVSNFEDEISVQMSTIRMLQSAFDGAPGVRLRPAPRVLSIDELNASNDE